MSKNKLGEELIALNAAFLPSRRSSKTGASKARAGTRSRNKAVGGEKLSVMQALTIATECVMRGCVRTGEGPTPPNPYFDVLIRCENLTYSLRVDALSGKCWFKPPV